MLSRIQAAFTDCVEVLSRLVKYPAFWVAAVVALLLTGAVALNRADESSRSRILQMKLESFANGQKAGKAGIPHDACPWSDLGSWGDNTLRQEWLKGWIEGKSSVVAPK
jgi:ribosome modulation factor